MSRRRLKSRGGGMRGLGVSVAGGVGEEEVVRTESGGVGDGVAGLLRGAVKSRYHGRPDMVRRLAVESASLLKRFGKSRIYG